MRRIFIGLLLLSLTGCALCGPQALWNADKYQKAGYATRIVVYDLQLDGLLYGAFIYKFHAQCQVLKDGQWLYVGEFGGLSFEPTFRMKRIQYEWTPEAFRALLAQHAKL
jgi:hypothetical protein